jgi:hypothetical protein
MECKFITRLKASRSIPVIGAALYLVVVTSQEASVFSKRAPWPPEANRKRGRWVRMLDHQRSHTRIIFMCLNS